MTKKEFEAKYKDVLLAVFEANGKTSEPYALLVSSIRGHFGGTYEAAGKAMPYEVYPGIPDSFDWEQAYSDWQSVVKG